MIHCGPIIGGVANSPVASDDGGMTGLLSLVMSRYLGSCMVVPMDPTGGVPEVTFDCGL